MPEAVVCVPWIETGCPWREKARRWTQSYWSDLGLPVVYGLDDSRPVNRSRARNKAALASDADVFLFCDADMWVPEAQAVEAIRRAASGEMVLAYTEHVRLTKWATTRTYEGTETLQGQRVMGCSSGVFAISARSYAAVGGHDERFTGWGYEDRCFLFACDVLVGSSRLAGPSYHLWHPRNKDQARTTEERRAGEALALRYKRAAGVTSRSGILRPTKDAEPSVEAMRALLEEDGGPLNRCAP